jgi:ribulose 1,5-bisphosphate carboxylase large subunit-like protein
MGIVWVDTINIVVVSGVDWVSDREQIHHDPYGPLGDRVTLVIQVIG